MTCLAYWLLPFQVTAVVLAGVTERWLAPWLPWFRRYLATGAFALTVGLALADSPLPPLGSITGIGLLYWNMWTGLPSLGAALTAVQAAAFRREATAT